MKLSPKISKQKNGHPGTLLEIFLISEILAVLCYKEIALQVNPMTDPFKIYLQTLQADLARGNASEHTHKPALKTLLEALEPGAGVERICG